MAVYVMSDLHLSIADPKKSMEVFGGRWQGYTDKIKRNISSLLTERDTLVIPGDICWAISLEEAREDLAFLHSLPGKKLLGKGNHDYWWATMNKMQAFLAQEGFTSLSFLYNNAVETEEMILCGTRGWFQDEEDTLPETDYEKIVLREAGRLRLSLEAAMRLPSAAEKEKVVFLHFPPVFNGKETTPILELLAEYKIRQCFFGHIHGAYAFPSVYHRENTDFHMISADYLSFVPRLIHPTR